MHLHATILGVMSNAKPIRGEVRTQSARCRTAADHFALAGTVLGIRYPLSAIQSAMREGQVLTETSFERSPMLKACLPRARKCASTGTWAAWSLV